MPYTIEEPVTTTSDSAHKQSTTTHPSYAQIGASRISGGTMLYGSDFQHQNYISIRIARSEQIRNLSNDHHYAKNELIEVSLSEAQWATFVSSLNVGGVPCTLSAIDGQLVSQLPAPKSQKQTFKKEVVDAAAEGLDRLNELQVQIEDMKISQKAKDELKRQVDYVARSFTSSIPFVLKQFGEHMENTVEKAKIEINAYSTQMVMQTGLNALRGDASQLLTYEDVE